MTPAQLLDAARCFGCLTEKQLEAVQTYLLDQINGGGTGVLGQIANAAGNTYEDVNFNIESINPPGIPTSAAIVSTSGQGALGMLALRYVIGNTMYVNVQMPHIWVPGTRIYPHVHIQPQTSNLNTIDWSGGYSIADPGGIFPAATPFSFQNQIPANNRWGHLLLPMSNGLAGIDMTGFTGPSTVVRLFYEVTNADESFDVMNFDVHYLWSGVPVDFTP